jgi:hypothetical protein
LGCPLHYNAVNRIYRKPDQKKENSPAGAGLWLSAVYI